MCLSVWPVRFCLTALLEFSYSHAQEGKPKKALRLHAGRVGDKSLQGASTNKLALSAFRRSLSISGVVISQVQGSWTSLLM